MRLSELFENDEQNIQQAMTAWYDDLNSTPGASISNANSLALKYFNNAGRGKMSAGDAAEKGAKEAIKIAQGQQAKKDKTKQRKADAIAARNQAQADRRAALSKVDRVRPTITRANPDRIGKSGKKWGNQYYSDPAQAVGIKGAIAKNRPGAIAKRVAAKVDQVGGDAFDADNILPNLKSLNPRNRRNK